jgi:predicted MFS family arabinose efflux permease
MGIPRRVVATMTFGTGAVIANLYYAQPLEEALARAFHASTGQIGLVITLLQVGYAIGLATLVPLGDLVERRKLMVSMLGVAVLGLAGMAAAPGLAVACSAAVLIGVTVVAAQVIVPFAAHLADPSERGQVVGTVMSGLLIGILLSRSVAGFVAQFTNWRTVFAVAAVLTAAVALLLWRELPSHPPVTRLRYPALLRSVLRLIAEEPVLRRRMLYGSLSFAAFSVFWTSSGFLLARAPYHWSQAGIGAFALVGAAGAVAAKFAGRLADRGLAKLGTGAFVLAMALSWALLAVGGHSVATLLIGVILLDLGVQGTHIINQSLVYALRPDARSRLNTAYMTSYFLAGAIGSALSSVAYGSAGWGAVCLLGAVFPVLALLLWLGETLLGRRRSPRTDETNGAAPADGSGSVSARGHA